jgi:hypothetical protein
MRSEQLTSAGRLPEDPGCVEFLDTGLGVTPGTAGISGVARAVLKAIRSILHAMGGVAPGEPVPAVASNQ